MEKMKKIQEETKVVLRKAQEDMRKYANKKRSDADGYKVGDLVMLSTKDLKYQMIGRRTEKLIERFCKRTPNPRLRSDPVANPILHSNIGSYFHHSESTPLPPNTLSLFRLWLPMQRHKDTVVYNVDYSLQEPHLIF